MTVERWEEESDEEWAERLAEEIEVAENVDTTQYYVRQDTMAEDSIIINYVGKDSWTYKEHPEGPFTVAQILGWKKRAEKFDRLFPHLEYLAQHADEVITILQSSTQTARNE